LVAPGGADMRACEKRVYGPTRPGTCDSCPTSWGHRVKRSWLTWNNQDWEPTGRVARALLPFASRLTGSRSYGADLLFLLRPLVFVAAGMALGTIITAEPGRTLHALGLTLGSVAAIVIFFAAIAVLLGRLTTPGEDRD
jgi:hypothetical protein